MREAIREQLMQYAEEGYRDFSKKLIPDSKPLLGVRLPKLREIAKDIVKNRDWRTEVGSYEQAFQDFYFEETMLRGMIIGKGTSRKNQSKEDAMQMIEAFITHIDNWSLCDSFCSGLQVVSKNRDMFFPMVKRLISSEKEFEARVGIILLLDQYLKFDKMDKKVPRKQVVTLADVHTQSMETTMEKFPYLREILDLLNQPFPQGYYTKMAAAWTIAEAFVCFPDVMMRMLCKDCCLDEETRKKAIRKICESKTPAPEVKEYIKTI